MQFSGSGSSDPEGTPLIYEWDLDGDGAYDDAVGVTASRTYTSPGNVTTALRVTDVGLATGTDTQVISVANNPPVPVISTPAAGTTWKVGDLITFSGSATDPEDGSVPAASLLVDALGRALPVELPHARRADVDWRRPEPLVQRAGPRVPVAPQADVDGHR